MAVMALYAIHQLTVAIVFFQQVKNLNFRPKFYGNRKVKSAHKGLRGMPTVITHNDAPGIAKRRLKCECL